MYLSQQRGKEIRSKLIGAFDFWLRLRPHELKAISEVVEMLHTASLLIDDVEDGSELRRGIPVAHKVYGLASTINSGNYVYFLALKKALSLNNPEIMHIFADELVNLHKGQGMEIYWRDNNICPTEAEYMEMISNKTGGLLRLAVRMMQAMSEVKEDFVPLVDMLGIHFQIRDDYLNLVSDEFTTNKGFAEDLTEGKFSYPVIRHIQSLHMATVAGSAAKGGATPVQTQLTVSQVADASSRQLFRILRQRTGDDQLKRYAIAAMRGTLAALRGELCVLEDRARAEVRRLGGNAGLERIIAFLGAAYRKDDATTETKN
ncbi:Geranylgeranyl pyrophosphate synthase [Entophlyctis luteolus]|nr:Geranylgeranyl pyrophosphate synthase [Entophlyctis luteolus]KAJ3378588.1 Geranylgeranyl pyrophosphate synthase [Entophlyctis sp. JEL0112]